MSTRRGRGGGGRPVGGFDPAKQALKTLMSAPGLLAFFDPDWQDGLSLRESGGTQYVTAMLDRTEQHVVAQATEGSQPALGTLGTRRALLFDGSDDRLLGAPAVAQVMHEEKPYSQLVVVRRAAGVLGGYLSAAVSNTFRVTHRITAAGAVDCYRNFSGSISVVSSTGAAPVSTGLVIAGVFDGSAYTATVNGTVVISEAALSKDVGTDANSLVIGATANTQYFNGHIAGVLVASGAWTTEERQALESAAAIYWGVL